MIAVRETNNELRVAHFYSYTYLAYMPLLVSTKDRIVELQANDEERDWWWLKYLRSDNVRGLILDLFMI